jgi:hypothetical protein
MTAWRFREEGKMRFKDKVAVVTGAASFITGEILDVNGGALMD